jgi:Ni/Co efflux regulator RcnB
MLIKKFIIGLLSFYTFEIKRASIQDTGSVLSSTSIERLYESRKKREQERKKTKLYDKRKWKEKKKYREKHYKLKGTTPKDARFSNQQKLRRMYRNT